MPVILPSLFKTTASGSVGHPNDYWIRKDHNSIQQRGREKRNAFIEVLGIHLGRNLGKDQNGDGQHPCDICDSFLTPK
jgi:hypothetical protein